MNSTDTDSFHNWNHRYYGLRLTGCLVTATDDLDAGERPYAVVHTYHPLRIVRHEGESVLYGVETCLSAIRQQILHLKMILFAEFLPIVLLRLRQHEDDLQVLRIRVEALYRPHQHGLPANGQKLLGNVRSHPQSLPPSHDDYKITIHN